MQQLNQEVFKTLRIVFGVVSDKDLNSIAHILPKEAIYYFCQPDIPRAMDARDLFNKMTHFGFKGYCKSSVNEAYQMALKDASLKDVIYIGGSTFVVAEVV